MSQVRDWPDGVDRPWASALAVSAPTRMVLTTAVIFATLAVVAVTFGGPIATPAAATAQPPQPARQLPAQDEDGGGQQNQQDDGTGVVCPDDPSEEKDMSAGWWADYMQLEELHERVPEQGENVRVAVLDTGLWETPQFWNANLVDPIDLTTGTPHEVPGSEKFGGQGFTWDCDGHGTAVAGLIMAQPSENVPKNEVPDGFDSDMVGVAPNVELQPIRISVGRDDGAGTDLTSGIYQAVEHGAQIINISIEMDSPYNDLEDAIAYARQHDVLIVAAAGNSGSIAFPGAYAAKYDNVISVGSVNQQGLASDFTSPSSVTVAAPGEKIVSTNRGVGHLEEDGTSFAAPLVSGVAALMMNHFDEISPQQIRDRLMATADPVAEEGADSKVAGAGAINPIEALTAIVDTDAASRDLEVKPYPGRHEPPPPDTMPRNVALVTAGGAVAIAVVALAALATVRRARARGWRPGD